MKKARYALGIDIGGTKIALGVVAEDGRVLTRASFPTDARQGFDAAVRRMATVAQQAIRESRVNSATIIGAGIGCAGPVNPRTGVIDNPHTLPGWEGRNVVAALSTAIDAPVWLENDADTAAIGEYYHGAGQGADRLAMLTFGTGVGGAVVLGGEIYRGAGGEHPEFGHMPAASSGAVCYCGRQGCVESLASGPAMADAGRVHGFLDTNEVFAAAESGDPRAQSVLGAARGAVDAAIWGLLHGFLPGRIVLGGGLVDVQPAFFLDAARAAVSRARLLSGATVTVAPAQLGNLAGMIGAARWALERAAQFQTSHPTPSS